MTAAALSSDTYPIADPDSLPSPRLLVFRARVDSNIEQMRRHLEAVAPGTGFDHLRTHVKTHKSSWTARRMLDAGITRFKATPNELDLLLDAGARDIFVAYPLLAHEADRLAHRVAANPGVRILAQVGCDRHIDDLEAAAARHRVRIETLIDLDVGMHRTGAPPAATSALHARIASASHLEFAGIHAYDGHNKGPTPDARRAAAGDAMATLLDAAAALADRGVAVPLLVAGGTPGFLADLEILAARAPGGARVEVSPGTWIYWDTNYETLLPGLFDFAALVFCRVMDRPGDDLVTLDLGHKRWAIDSGPVTLFSEPGLEVVATNEEHTVLRRTGESRHALEVGDPLLIAPRHVCSTVNLWESFTLIGAEGEVEMESVAVDGRNR